MMLCCKSKRGGEGCGGLCTDPLTAERGAPRGVFGRGCVWWCARIFRRVGVCACGAEFSWVAPGSFEWLWWHTVILWWVADAMWHGCALARHHRSSAAVPEGLQYTHTRIESAAVCVVPTPTPMSVLYMFGAYAILEARVDVHLRCGCAAAAVLHV